MHQDELQQIGLSEKEAKVYLATLTLGKATAQEIAKKCDLKRPTTYFTIDVLMKKGLMSSVYEGKKQFFMAENPDRLVDVFEARQAEIRRQGEKLKKLIPDLKQLRPKTDGGPVVKYYTGKEGALSMAKSLATLADKRGVWIMYPYDTVQSLYTPEELEKINFRRVNRQVYGHALYTAEHETLAEDEFSKRHKIENTNKFPVTADIAVYGDIVRLTSFDKDVLGVMIEDPSIAETVRTLFKFAWEGRNNMK
jgi:sugar-specific transcriptional regulator TrmB